MSHFSPRRRDYELSTREMLVLWSFLHLFIVVSHSELFLPDVIPYDNPRCRTELDGITYDLQMLPRYIDVIDEII